MQVISSVELLGPGPARGLHEWQGRGGHVRF